MNKTFSQIIISFNLRITRINKIYNLTYIYSSFNIVLINEYFINLTQLIDYYSSSLLLYDFTTFYNS